MSVDGFYEVFVLLDQASDLMVRDASRARSVCRLVDSCQPTTRRENTSITNAT